MSNSKGMERTNNGTSSINSSTRTRRKRACYPSPGDLKSVTACFRGQNKEGNKTKHIPNIYWANKIITRGA